METTELIGAIGGGVGAVTGIFALVVTWRRDRDSRWLRRREIPGLLASLEAEHEVELLRLEERLSAQVQAINSDHAARGMFDSGFRIKAVDRGKLEAQRDKAKLVREYERASALLQDELDRIGGRAEK